jgi:uncharacterized damage-inducible protein DinB
MIAQTLLEIYQRDLDLLKTELSLYKNEADIWALKGDVKNSAGTLVLHLAGNLNHFIGAVLGKSGYIRQRDKEFSDRNISREKLRVEIDRVSEMLTKTLTGLSDEDVMKAYPADFSPGKTSTTLYVLARLISHFNYHLGQVNYHRRLISL